MKPWNTASSKELSLVRGVALDIDDTLSTDGKLTADAYTALWALRDAGFWVVPLTGRPAGWCDHIARFWPVDAVVGENGAFTFFMKSGRLQRLTTPGALPADEVRTRLERLKQTVREHFPRAQWASDQRYREYDLAIDFCEDVDPWPAQKIEQLVEVCQQAGARAKISSIHVNAWYGEYDKLSGFRHWIKTTRTAREEHWIFVGDSPNDEPLFAGFRRSVGVANVKKFKNKIKNLPTWVTVKKSGQGFVEVASRLIRARR